MSKKNGVPGHPDRLPDLTQKEVGAALEWARRAKAGERIELNSNDGDLVGVTVERGDLERA